MQSKERRRLSNTQENSESWFSPRTARGAFNAYSKNTLTQKPVKKINVNLDSVHHTYTLDDEDLQVEGTLSSSEMTEFNVLSSGSDIKF